MGVRAGVLVLALALSTALAPGARADPPAPSQAVVVVRLDGGVVGFDAHKLREAIREELQVDAVAPDDALASKARGTIAVSIDRGARTLVVSYSEAGKAGAPVTRTVDLPDDIAATTRAAVLLAGNLARDEAGELAAALRRSKESKEMHSSEQSPEAPTDDDERGKLDRLGASLEAHARHGHGVQAVWWSMMGLSIAAGGVGLGLSVSGHTNAAAILEVNSTSALLLSNFFVSGNFDELVKYYKYERDHSELPDLARADIEAAWQRSARKEHRIRKIVGWMETVVGGVGLAVPALLVASAKAPLEQAPPLSIFAWWLASDAAALAVGVSFVATDGPVESGLHGYEASAGHSMSTPSSRNDITPRFSLSSRGAVVGLGGRF